MIDPSRPPLGTPAIVRQGPKPAGYSLSLEILATIPTGFPCDIRTLACDFRMTFHEMTRMLNRLRDRFGIAVSKGSAMVTGKSRARVEAECLYYWRNVYETDLPPA